MNPPSNASPGAPGHYGAGYGEKTPELPTAPDPALESADDAPAGLEPATALGADASADKEAPADAAGEAVVFTPDDVTARPPDHTPTEAAPESEKASLIFERS